VGQGRVAKILSPMGLNVPCGTLEILTPTRKHFEKRGQILLMGTPQSL